MFHFPKSDMKTHSAVESEKIPLVVLEKNASPDHRYKRKRVYPPFVGGNI